MKKKANRNTSNKIFFVRIYYIKRVSKKFHPVFVQRQRNVVTSVLHVLTCKVVVLPVTETCRFVTVFVAVAV